jgi:general secretion pathway protein A
MYTAHFGLSEPPFSIAPDPRFLFMSRRHREALAHLLYGVTEGGGFVQLTGEVGTGKTTICRCFLEQLPANVDAALIINPRIQEHELVAAVCDELGAVYPAASDSIKVLVDHLNRHLLAANARGRRTVLIVDEAQNLSFGVLELVRLLTNLETERHKLLQIVLIGQPELIGVLDRPELRQLAQRITARYHLDPLNLRETEEYIAHRLAVARVEGTLFTPGAVRRIHRCAGGIPRLINVLCDRALLGAYAGNRRRVTAGVVRRGAREVFGRSTRRPRRWWAPYAAAAVLLAAALPGLWWLTGAGSPWRMDGGAAGQRSAVQALEAFVPAAATPATAPQDEPEDLPGGEPETSIDALLDGQASGERGRALAALAALWLDGQDLPASLDCDGAARLGLACLAGRGTWNNLRVADRPAVLELMNGDGEARFAILHRLDSGVADIEIGGQRARVPLARVDQRWFGEYVLLWRRPELGSNVILPGSRGADVLWLRQRLAVAEGREPPEDGAAPLSNLYDAELAERVRRFQRSRSIHQDGIAGAETLMQLNTVVNGDQVPRLTGPDA